VPASRGGEWARLIGVALTGAALFNIAFVCGVEYAASAVLAVAGACVAIVLALLGPALEHARPARRVALAAAVVTGGGALVEGAGHTDAIGLGWAALALGNEAAFTLLAVPVIGRLGVWGVAVHTTWISAVLLAALAVGIDGPAATTRLDAGQLAAIGYLAVVVAAPAFVLRYGRHSSGGGIGRAAYRRCAGRCRRGWRLARRARARPRRLDRDRVGRRATRTRLDHTHDQRGSIDTPTCGWNSWTRSGGPRPSGLPVAAAEERLDVAAETHAFAAGA